MANEEKPRGLLFTHVYLDRTHKNQDSKKFRKRIGTFCHNRSTYPAGNLRLGDFLILEKGIHIAGSGKTYYLDEFFQKININDVLDVITLVWKFYEGSRVFAECVDWIDFVQRVLQEENLCYYLDDKCGVHRLVDEEFNHNRVSTLAGLQDSKYSGVRDAFEHAFQELDSNPPHTKDAVRSIFESIEILVKLMVVTNNLNKSVVQKALKEKVLEVYKDDPTAKNSVEKMFDGFGFWVDAIHNYRHGQGVPEPVEPPMDFAVYVLSSGASFLRWLLEIDKAISVNR